MPQYIETKQVKEKVVLVGAILGRQTEALVSEYLDELEFLVDTAGGETMRRFTQKLDRPDPATFIGKGKFEEITAYVKEHEIDLVVFDDELSPSQHRNLERTLKCRVIDRSNLILDIFAQRARTAHARTQVELAQYQYLLPRLAGMWTHLERQKGGIGLKGPGEKEIETDRRIVRDKIALLKEKLRQIDKQKATQRSNRGSLVRVALVGYTNVGKSTIMNLLSKSEVFAEDKLFATLDTTVRKVVIGNLPFLLSDTVGFIRKLPHHLIESFKSTLDEVRESDILVHVVDLSHPGFEDQINVVKETLGEITGGEEKTTIMIFNKIDKYTFVEKEEDDLLPPTRENTSLAEMQQSWMGKVNAPCLFISAKKKQNLEPFRRMLYDHVHEIHKERYPYDNFLY
ncbi:MAG: GTPase HflX [Bacteroidales bacterium]|jgi:GTP-binding protein HflX|nr:GTPase HflX [Bacteroidales bacterium]